MSSAIRSLCCGFAVFLLPVAAHGKIRDPGFEELCKSSQAIVVVHVKATLPAPFSVPGAVVASILLAVGVFCWSRRATTRLRAVLLACIIAVLSAAIGTAVVASLPRAHRSVALAEVQKTLKGSTAAYIPIFYHTNFVCDVTELKSGNDYVLFLDSHCYFGYRMSWYDWSAWQITAEGVQTVRRSWDGERHVPLESFFDEVALVNK